MDVEREIDILKDEIHRLKERFEDIKPLLVFLREQEEEEEEEEKLKDMECWDD